MRYAILTFFLLLISGETSPGQIPIYDTANESREVLNREAQIRNSELWKSENQREIKIRKHKGFFGTKLKKEQKERLNPLDSDVKKYKDFLKDSENGIVKILPNPKCDTKIVDVSDLKCVQALPNYGNGSIYSFYTRSHLDTTDSRIYRTSNISFLDDKFFVQFRGNLLGLITTLDISDINSVSLETKEIKGLKSFSPTREYSELFSQQEKFYQTKNVEGKIYTTAVPAKLNNLYAMRTVNYYNLNYFGKIHKYYDDLTLVFQVVNQDSDGALTLIWRDLDEKTRVQVSK